MSYAPASILQLGRFWVDQGGANLGIVGDLAHAQRASYHNGKDRITKYGRTRATDYSIRSDRDWNGLTDAAAALDLGLLNGRLTELQAFSVWFAKRCSDRAPGTQDVREVIYSPDGRTVLRWDHVNGRTWLGGTGTGHGDNSHLWHTHISFYRDSQLRSKLGLFSPYFIPIPDTGTEDPTVNPDLHKPALLCDVSGPLTVYANPDRTARLIDVWNGGRGIFLYAEAKVATSGGKATLVPILLDMAGGDAEDLRIGWVGTDRVSNVRSATPCPPVDCTAEVEQARKNARAGALEDAAIAAAGGAQKAVDALPR